MLNMHIRFSRLKSPGKPSSTAVGSAWIHHHSGTRIHPGFGSVGIHRASGAEYTCKVFEHASSHQPVFSCSMKKVR